MGLERWVPFLFFLSNLFSFPQNRAPVLSFFLFNAWSAYRFTVGEATGDTERHGRTSNSIRFSDRWVMHPEPQTSARASSFVFFFFAFLWVDFPLFCPFFSFSLSIQITANSFRNEFVASFFCQHVFVCLCVPYYQWLAVAECFLKMPTHPVSSPNLSLRSRHASPTARDRVTFRLRKINLPNSIESTKRKFSFLK